MNFNAVAIIKFDRILFAVDCGTGELLKEGPNIV